MTPADAIASLARAGWSQKRIAAAAETSQPTIHRITQGTSPAYELGARLIALASHKAPDEKSTEAGEAA